MTPLLYSNNADIKYPLSDFHEADIPNDLLLDLSISVPDGLDPVLGVIRVGLSFVFISLENRSDRTPIASAILTNPVAARVYPLTMDVTGFGWVVFGPRAVTGDAYLNEDVVDLDPEIVQPVVQTAPALALTVNGFDRDVTNFLEILSGSVFLTLSVEDGVVYIDRNDDELSTDDLISLGVEQDIADQNQTQLLYTVDGTPPDENGNLDIDIIGCAAGCGDVRELTVPRGDTGQGTTDELPLDEFSERRYAPGDPCGPSGEEESTVPEDDPFDGCTNIIVIDIIDPSTGFPIGSLYTVVE
jgi:hypothetical protein